ncbi:MAG: virginiamycin B lyase family protein [Rhodospirillales bacterium]
MHWFLGIATALLLIAQPAGATGVSVQAYPVPAGAHPHDVAPAPDGTVWYTAQRQGALGRLDPKTGKTQHVPLGDGSQPHGVVVAADGLAWVTDSGLNAMVSVDPKTLKVTVYPLPGSSGYANMNTPAIDAQGLVWFTGQSGVYGRVDPKTGEVKVFKAPRGRGPYGMDRTPDGVVWFSSLAGSYIARVDSATGKAEVFDPPTSGAGVRRVWSDSKGMLWGSHWNTGQLSRFDPKTKQWKEWKLPGDDPAAYAVYVDDKDMVWVSDFGANAMVRFNPKTEKFETFKIPRRGASVRQILGRKGEVWTPESGTDHLTVYRYD